MSPTNAAAWIKSEKAFPLEVDSAPYTQPGENEIVIKNHAIGLNLIDYARQSLGAALIPWTTYPTIMGSDVAGEVVDIGAGSRASQFKLGDRVVGLTGGLKISRSAEGAFQNYVVLKAHMTAPIPASLSYEEAAGIPLGISTAACGLFQKDYLALQHPTTPRAASTGQTLLIWSGSSCVGSNAIQLAVAAGYEVFTTASPRNFDFVKSLGASQAFDYKSETVIDDIVAAFKGKPSAGTLAIGRDSVEKCGEIVSRIEGKKFVALVNPPSGPLPNGVGSKFVFGSDLAENEVGPAIFVDFLPKALAEGTFVSAPQVEVVGKGLEALQDGLEVLKKGVSAKKLVVSL
ncbi:oxidoreductase [Aspergillus heteromorphus CBS 117.55]|uniref:Oxidoreductase n=1 Tax=Aspergillus heteromorphus CBS 117.55 TaxID=1448321 RepID=A0A317VBF7_9EURO|nr:oxidoreductase [Aspergillus heteromorphus CBS 117.55]PWY70282.1 oxidoreductase [Aspergillus heteromorphus CBS 117.55]